MQKLFFTLFMYALLGISTGFAQTVNFEDGFEDGDFTNAPVWSGDTGDFEVIDDTPNYLLHLNAAGASPSYLSTPSTNTTGVWNFYIEYRGFEYSGSNKVTLFLMSDIADLEGTVNGYAIQVGQSGDDFFELVRYDRGSEGATVLTGTTVVGDQSGYTVRVTRDNSGNWQMQVAEGYGGSYNTAVTGTDNTYTTSSYFGPKIEYSSSRSDKFYFDFKIDLPPFNITQAKVNGSNVDVAFNRAYDQSTVQAGDFTIDNGIGSPSSLTFVASDTVRLNYGSSFSSNKYTVTAQNIDDQNGNTIANDATASFIIFDTYAPGDVIINEFLYDPPSDQAEYVELKNLSGKYLNLQGWQIGDKDANETISTGTVTLEPNAFLAVAVDSSELFNVYGSRNYFEMSNLRGLNNGGDVVQVLTGTGTQVDSLTYTQDWGGNNVALERRSDTAPPIQANFGDSPNALGGTPGLANEVADDTTPPNLDNLIITDNQTLDLDFSEQLASSPATNTANYTLNNGITVNNAQQTADDSVRLNLSTPLQNGTTYQLTISNQQDIFGNTAANIDTSFTFYVITPADSGDIFINEFTYDPPEGSTEYIELYNPTNESFDLNGWTINDNTGNLKTITNSQFIVPPDSFVVLAPDNTLLTDNPDIALVNMGSGFTSLNNSGDDIVLRNASGVRLDSLRFTPAWGGTQIALERRTTDVRPIQANFGDAPNGFGTPGRQNQIGNDTTPPDLASFSIINNQSLQFVFTEQVESQSATNVNNYSLSNGITVNSATQSDGNTVRVGLSGSLQNNTSYTASIDGIQDLFGNTLNNRDTTFTYFETTPADSGDIFINEFTYDPPSGSTEYIELYNPTNESFDLNGWTVNDNTGNRNTITNSQFIVPPDSFVVLAPDRTLQDSLPNINLLSMGSSFPSLNNSGDDIVLRNASGVRLDSLRYTSAFGGNNIAVERRTTNAPPVQSNFGDAPNGFGTPGRQNQIGNDTTPPNLTDLGIPDNQTLTLAFSEGLAEGPATTPGNYTLDNGINISTAQQTADDSVHLGLSNPLQNGTTYQLNITNQRDIFGNTAAQIDTSFTYFETTPADSGDIFINEFTYDPPSGSTEYIELKNTTTQSFDLNGWTINDNRGTPRIITNSRAIVPPDSFVVIAEDNTLLASYPDINLVTMGGQFPSLNNSGDAIVLRNASGVRLDSLTYTSDFGGNNVALERRTTDAPPIQANFGDAPNGFGTPGSANQIQPDNQAPVLLSARVLDSRNIQLLFSEAISFQTAKNTNNYTIVPSRNIQLVSAVQDTVILLLEQNLQSEQTYQITVQNLQDVFGNTITPTTKPLVSFAQPQPGEIVINEFLPTSPEFVELFNTTDKNFDLSNWVIGDASNTATIGTGTLLGPGEYIVFSERSLPTNIKQKVTSVVLNDLPSLDNDEDVIYVQTDNGITVDSLSYTPAFGGSIDGKSAERIDPGAASNDASNFTTSKAEGGSTPGDPNSVFNIDQSSPSITFSRIFPNGDIEVRFSEFIKLTPDLTFLVNGQAIDTVDSFNPSNGNVIFLTPAAGTATGPDLTVTAQNLSDVKGNVTASTKLAVSQPLMPGDVVINEILYDPLNDSDDNKPDQSEYIEIRNIRDYAITLENITLHDAPDENGEVRSLTPVSTTSKYIPAQGTALIYAEDATSIFAQSKVAKFFDVQNSTSNSVIRIDRSSLSLASSGDAIYLAGGNGATIDSVFYDETWQNPNLVDDNGIALERINPLGPSNNDVNWGSSTAETGGTPNQENTLFETPQQGGQQDIGISFSANPFSPDGDGIDENLLINYKLDQPDFLITVRIYDRYGRLVRELADGQQAGLQGSLIWDGLKDNGNHNRIGIYIVIFKAFDSASGNNKAFKKTVVLARRLN